MDDFCKLNKLSLAPVSLALISDLNSLPGLPQHHPRRVLLGGDRPLLRLVLDERYPLAPRDRPRLPEPLEAPEDGDQRVHVVALGQVLHEENLVRREVLVGDHGGGGGVRGFEARAAGWLRGAGGYILGRTGLEALLLLDRLGGSPLVCAKVSLTGALGTRKTCVKELTLFGNAPALVLLKVLVVTLRLHGGIALRPRHGQAHRLLKQIKPLQVGNRTLRRLGVIEDDEGLALRAEVRLGDYVDDIAVLCEDVAQGLLEGLGLDALFEVLDVYPKAERVSLMLAIHVGVQ